jgi:hypothetical protein
MLFDSSSTVQNIRLARIQAGIMRTNAVQLNRNDRQLILMLLV